MILGSSRSLIFQHFPCAALSFVLLFMYQKTCWEASFSFLFSGYFSVCKENHVFSHLAPWAFHLLSWTNCNSCKDCFLTCLLASNKRTALFGWCSLFCSQGIGWFPMLIYHLHRHSFWMSKWINVFKHWRSNEEITLQHPLPLGCTRFFLLSFCCDIYLVKF